MSDFPPGLPPRSSRRRPLPPGGAAAAIAAGRTRRHVAVGAGGGGLAAVLVVALALSLLGADAKGTDSLGPAAAASSSASATPTAVAGSPSAAPTATAAGSGQPAPSSCPDEDCSPSKPSTAATSPAPQPSETGVPTRPATRTSYTERPREFVDAATCLSVDPQSPADEPTFCTHADPQELSVPTGRVVSVEFQICATSDSPGAVVLGFAGGGEHDATVRAEGDATVLWRFSDTVRFTGGRHERSLDNRECLGYRVDWKAVDSNGAPLRAGRYDLELATAATEHNGRPMEHQGRTRVQVRLTER